MRRLIPLVLLSALAVSASGQLAVELRIPRDTFLKYESIPAIVSIRNFSGHSIQLQSTEAKLWLDFVITTEDGGLIGAVGNQRVEEPLAIAAGQTVTRTVDLLPLFDLRTRGNYRVQTVVDTGGARVISSPARFTIVNGREIWSQTVGLPVNSDHEEYRTYSLLTRRGEHDDSLYVSVVDKKSDLVYGALPLGTYLAVGEPDARLDKAARLHVLFRTGPRLFNYACVDAQAKVSERAVYTDVLSVPQLTVNATGEVIVTGGEMIYPRNERAKNETEAAPSPTVQEKSKKSSSRRKPPPESNSTNAPVTNFRPR